MASGRIPTPTSRLANPKRTPRIAIVIGLAVSMWVLGVGPRDQGVVFAQPPPPALTDTVNDFANVIDSSSRAELDRRIRALRGATGDTLVVATVPTYQPYGSIDEYAVKIFENGGRGIGDKGKDNGLLIVVAVQDRKVRIEVGYDLEQFIPDGFAGETIRQAITPAFRAGQYGPGLLAGATRLINRIAQQRGVTIPDVPVERTSRSSTRRFPFVLIFWIIVAIIIISRSNRGGPRRYWGGGPWSGWTGGVGGFGGGGFGGTMGGFGGGGGGFGGGGFGGFGGGGSGGGGASGGW
jgi:uncharacterized protein